MKYRASQKVVVKTTSNLLFYNKLLVVFMSITHDFHKWKSDFFGNPYIDPYIDLPIIWVRIFLIKKNFLHSDPNNR